MPRTGKSKKQVKATTVCESCGTEFEHPPSQDRTYCSNPCYHEAVSQLSQTKESRSQRETVESVEVFDALDGLHNQMDVTKLLVRAGYETEEDLRQADPRNLLRITGVGKGTVSQLCRNLEEPWPTPFRHGP